MDPITIWLVVLATAWFIRRAAEDGYAAVRGQTSPRIARRRDAYQLAQQQAVETGTPRIGQAVAGRVAARIADRRPPGPMRRYVAGLWEDSWNDAQERRDEKRSQRVQRPTSRDAKQKRKPLRTRACLGHCGVLVIEPAEWCPDCERAQRNDQADQPPNDDIVIRDEPADRNPDDLAICRKCFAHPVARDGFGYCAPCARLLTCHNCHAYPVETDRDGQCPECANATAEETPEPAPAPDTTRKDTPTMPAPFEISGDTTSPVTTLAFVEGGRDLNRAIQNELDLMINILHGKGVGTATIQLAADVSAQTEQFESAAAPAQEDAARHVAAQADLAGDTELRDAVRGYLSSANA